MVEFSHARMDNLFASLSLGSAINYDGTAYTGSIPSMSFYGYTEDDVAFVFDRTGDYAVFWNKETASPENVFCGILMASIGYLVGRTNVVGPDWSGIIDEAALHPVFDAAEFIEEIQYSPFFRSLIKCSEGE